MENQIILVTGSSGLVGSYLLPKLISQYKSVYVTSHIVRPGLGSPIGVDLSNPDLLTKVLEKIKPAIIVNLAAFTDVDGCEINKEYALQLNSRLPRIISDYIRFSRLGAEPSPYLLHISTDYVFDGQNGNYKEESEPNPINWYGKTKLGGEQEIMTNLNEDEWCIARISTPFGIHQKKQSFPVYIINKIRKDENANVVADQYTSASYSLDLAKMFVEIIERRITNIIHTACLSRLSRYEQAVKVAQAFGLNPDLILKSSSDLMNWLAPRPKDSSLDVSKALKLLNHRPRDYDESIRDFAFEFAKSTHNEG